MRSASSLGPGVPGFALVLLLIFGVVGFLGRMFVQLRRTGSTGFKGISGAPGSSEWLAGVLLVAGIAASVLGPVLDLSEALGRIGVLDGEFARAAGVGLAMGGIFTTSYSQLAMGDEWRIGVDESERTQLVTSGPFAMVRNPIYAGMVPFFAGIALMVPNVLTLAGAVAVLVALELQTRLVEEPYLLRLHGEEYRRYAARVGRFIPGIGRLRS